jgi:hypothetical protein
MLDAYDSTDGGKSHKEIKMGQIYSRGEAWCDPNYIVNVTTNIIRKNALMRSAGDRGGRDGHAVRIFFWSRIEKEVQRMSDQTLGRICAYGGPEGIHVGPAGVFPFLNMTGFKDVTNWKLDPLIKTGRGLMEEIAILTICCITRDIIMQQVWQEEFAGELKAEEEYDRAMAGYIHCGPQQ